MLFLLEVHAIMEKFHAHNNVKCLIDETTLFLGEWGVRVRCKDKEIERTMVFHHIFASVPRTFGDYCSLAHYHKLNTVEMNDIYYIA